MEEGDAIAEGRVSGKVEGSVVRCGEQGFAAAEEKRGYVEAVLVDEAVPQEGNGQAGGAEREGPRPGWP